MLYDRKNIEIIKKIFEVCIGRTNYLYWSSCANFFTCKFVKDNVHYIIKMKLYKDTLELEYKSNSFKDCLEELKKFKNNLEYNLHNWFPNVNIINTKIFNNIIKQEKPKNIDFIARLNNLDLFYNKNIYDDIKEFVDNEFAGAIYKKSGWQGTKCGDMIFISSYVENNNYYKIILVKRFNRIDVTYDFFSFEEDKEVALNRIESFRNKFKKYLSNIYDKKQIKEDLKYKVKLEKE